MNWETAYRLAEKLWTGITCLWICSGDGLSWTAGWSRCSSIPTTWTGRMADLESVMETSHLLSYKACTPLLSPTCLACLWPFWGPNVFPIIFLQDPSPTNAMIDVLLCPSVSSHTSSDSNPSPLRASHFIQKGSVITWNLAVGRTTLALHSSEAGLMALYNVGSGENCCLSPKITLLLPVLPVA